VAWFFTFWNKAIFLLKSYFNVLCLNNVENILVMDRNLMKGQAACAAGYPPLTACKLAVRAVECRRRGCRARLQASSWWLSLPLRSALFTAYICYYIHLHVEVFWRSGLDGSPGWRIPGEESLVDSVHFRIVPHVSEEDRHFGDLS